MLKIRCFSIIILTAISGSLLATPKEKPKSLPATPFQLIDIAYFSQSETPPTETLSNLDPFLTDTGREGAELAIKDNNTTGEFTHQKFVLHSFTVPENENAIEFFKTHITTKYSYVITHLNAVNTLAVADLEESKNRLFFDAGTVDDTLRNEQCRTNMLHLLPSRAMKADALAQYMMKKRWSKWFLVVGHAPEDKLFAESLKRAAKRFGMKIVIEKEWDHTFDSRRSAQSDIAVFTQTNTDYDVLVLADEKGRFGEYFAYRTWQARPIIGTQGLIATAWHSTHELWGAAQIQHRFYELAKRNMEESDYGAYLAVRALGEATTRTKSNDLKIVKTYLNSPAFTLQGYKGNALSFREWDGQLRQAILLVSPRSLVTVAPIEGFLHPKTELDTLGTDEKESKCQSSLGKLNNSSR